MVVQFALPEKGTFGQLWKLNFPFQHGGRERVEMMATDTKLLLTQK